MYRDCGASGFTLIELLVSVAVMTFLLVAVLSIVTQSSDVWRRSSAKIEAFQDARFAFDLLTRQISQATLSSYLDYDNPTNPQNYLRHSDLKFLITQAGSYGVGTAGTGQMVFFQSPGSYTKEQGQYGGMESLLNACGYFVQFASDKDERPQFVANPENYRFRLMQLLGPAEENKIYSASGTSWFASAAADAQPIANNVIALVIRAQDPAAASPDLTPDYLYDSAVAFSGAQPSMSHQLPPVLQITMIAIDESAAKRLASGSAMPSVISSALSGKFLDPLLYESDLRDLEQVLNAAQPSIPYRIFSSAVPIRESRWSK